jgi:hypothetical protein
MSSPESSRVFVGRNRELAEALDALDEGSSGVGSLFLISGKAGIGKTWLTEEVAKAAGAGDFQVLWGRCREGPGIPTYWPWTQILRGAGCSLNSSAQPARDHLAAGFVGTAPASWVTASPSVAARDQFWLKDSIVHILLQSATSKPMLVILDDLHWADDLSLLLLEFLAAELTDTSLVVVGTFREPEVRTDPALRPIFGRLARLGHALPLRGFRRPEVDEILVRRFGLSLSPGTIDELCQLTGGNPWFIDQVVRLRLSEGAIDSTPSCPPAHPSMSEGIRAAVRRSLEPLAPEVQELLAIAAVLGNKLSLAALEKVTALSERRILELLAEPVLREIVLLDDLRPGVLHFCPRIVGEALYDDLDLPQRVELHRRIGEVVDGFSPTGDRATTDGQRPLRADGGKARWTDHPWSRSKTNGVVPESQPASVAESLFRCEGEYWTIAYAGTTVRLKDAKGLRYLAQLLARPLLEVHVADLSLIMGRMTREPGRKASLLAAGLSVRHIGDAGQLLDAKAKEAYRHRLEDLQEGLREAQEFNDCERTTLIEQEMDAVAHELAASVGLGGRDRKAASAAERARVNVTRTIRAAIDKIAQGNASLGRHLAVSVKTGTFCSYSPDPAVRTAWRL